MKPEQRDAILARAKASDGDYEDHQTFQLHARADVLTLCAALEAAEAKVQAALDAERQYIIDHIGGWFYDWMNRSEMSIRECLKARIGQPGALEGATKRIAELERIIAGSADPFMSVTLREELRTTLIQGFPAELDTARAEGRESGLREAFNAASGVMFDGMPASPQQIRKEVVAAIESLIAAPGEGKE